MKNKKPVYCMHCEKWQASSKADQCELSERIVVSPGSEAIGFEISHQELVYGKPSELNANHDCSHYEYVGFFEKIGRNWMHGIPLRPHLESKVEE